MARKRSGGEPNRSEFIREVLRQNPKAKHHDVVAAWQAAGHSGQITHTLFYKARLRKSRKSKFARRQHQKAKPVIEPKGSAPIGDYVAIERTLDRLVEQSEQLGDRVLTDAIRAARRRASAKLI